MLLFLLLTVSTPSGFAQAPSAASFEPTPSFPLLQDDALTLRQPALPSHPFTVTGRSGAILGMQDGTVELWQFPTKIFSALHLRAEVDGYSVPIELNPLAASIEVSPDHTTITYAHPAITVRQHMFVPVAEETGAATPNAGRGGQIVFEVRSVHPATLVISLTPALVQMWPAPQWGLPTWDWQRLGTGGVYTVSTDDPRLFGMIAMPDATPGPISPYQEQPRTLPIELRVRVDPAQGPNLYFPLLTALSQRGEKNDAQGRAAVLQRVLAEARELPEMYAQTRAYYSHFFDHRTVSHTPDPAFDRALQWAELAIDKSQATVPAQDTAPAETGLVAGWYPAFDSARPGFGWFFGRDTFWSMYAIDSYGDDALARRAIQFLIRRQRSDGKMPHEISQTADLLTGDMVWSSLPYEYAAADATPLFLLAMEDYVRSTGDLGFLQANWNAVGKAYTFERTHDSDGDGVYDNAQGTGWVEDWPTLPHQELYLAALDRDATHAMAQLATWTQHPELAQQAAERAAKLDLSVAAYQGSDALYSFSKNLNGSYDRTQTIYPTAAFWSRADGLPAPERQLRIWASHTFLTDWGMRAIGSEDALFDPLSYHRGTVWPLFTGWGATAFYRTGHVLAGYAALRQNLALTWAQDPGAVTELLSGRFYQPLGRSSTHQLWSSAMGVAPALRQLFGVEVEATRHTVYLHPHLPPEWDQATLAHMHVGSDEYDLSFVRAGGRLSVKARSDHPAVLCLRSAPAIPAEGVPCTERPSMQHEISLPLPALELRLPGPALPGFGAETALPHVLAENYTDHAASVLLEAPAGTEVVLALIPNTGAARRASTQDGVLHGTSLTVTTPPGVGWTQKQVTLRW